ncbi:uncharacterized protein DS421_9g265390 [Arachis hypogaea]|nr:uncharacterized protein DS421_9g265390 [Arachis hypogaea]
MKHLPRRWDSTGGYRRSERQREASMATRQQRTAAQQPPKHDDGKPSHSTTTTTPRHSNGGGKDGFVDRDSTKLAAMGFLHTCEHDGGDGVDGLPLDAALCLSSGECNDDDDQTAAA